MRTSFLILFLAVPCFSAGPKYSFPEADLNDEMQNIYKDIGNLLKGDVRISSVTISSATIRNVAVVSSATITNLTVGTLTTSTALGKILQFSLGTNTSNTTTTSSTFQSTALLASITPSSTSSRVFFMAVGPGYNGATGGKTAGYSVFRAGTNLGDATNGLGEVYSGSDALENVVMFGWDNPVTVSSITYIIKVRSEDNVTSVRWGNNSIPQILFLIETTGS